VLVMGYSLDWCNTLVVGIVVWRVVASRSSLPLLGCGELIPHRRWEGFIEVIWFCLSLKGCNINVIEVGERRTKDGRTWG